MSVDPRLARLQGRTATPNPNPSQTPPPPSQQPIPPSTPPAAATTTTAIAVTESPSVQPSADTVAISEPQVETISTTPPTQPSTQVNENYKLKFCTVCASNNNRSMEAHLRLSTGDKEFPVISFGTGSSVRLPGPSISQPQVYDFNTTSYTRMYEELQAQDARLYKNNGILNMLDRNRNIKWGPERFQDWKAGVARMEMINRGDKGAIGTEGGVVDVIFTCEERCWDAVVDNLLDRGAPLNRPVHVFNVDIRDNHEEALVGGRAILELANDLNDAANEERKQLGSTGWENGSGAARQSFDERVPDILGDWQTRWPNLPAQWTLSWL